MNEEIVEMKEKLVRKLSKEGELDEFEVLVFSRNNKLTRYANNTIHQQINQKVQTAKIRAIKGKKLINVSVTGTEKDIDNAIRKIGSNINASTDLPYLQGFIEKQKYKKIGKFGKSLTAEQRADLVEEIISVSKDYSTKTKMFGTIEALDYDFTIANSNGVEGEHSLNYNNVMILGISEDFNAKGYGRETITTQSPETLKIEEMAKNAVKISLDTMNAKSINPGNYTVILKEQAVREIIKYSIYGLQGPLYHQGNSAYLDKIGEKIFSEILTIEDRPLDPNTIFSSPFDSEGVAKSNKKIIENGIPKTLLYNTITASQYMGDKNLTSGHSFIPYTDYAFGGGAQNIVVKKGDYTEQEMIEDTKDGLLVQTFWYSNTLNWPKGIITGLTRDGLYMIKDGEIKHSVKNLRYTDSFLSFLKEIEGVGKRIRKIMDTNVPPMKIKSFKFSGKSKH